VSGLFHAPLLSLALLLASLLPLPAADPITTRTDEVGTLLNNWAAKGTSAGLSAITYENRDDAHSPLPLAMWPGLKTRTFTEDDRKAGRHKGPSNLIHPNPTFGNCSMAAPADRGGSLARFYFMDPSGATFLAKQYLSNQLYIYPEHQDYDPGGNGTGGWGEFRLADAGEVTLQSCAELPVRVLPRNIPVGAVMNLESVVLTPVTGSSGA
jgi:hypothetical protein